jgi:hypothetical protein
VRQGYSGLASEAAGGREGFHEEGRRCLGKQPPCSRSVRDMVSIRRDCSAGVADSIVRREI